MSYNPNPLPSLDATCSSAQNHRNLYLPLRRDDDTSQKAHSTPLIFKNPQNTRTQAIFFYTNDTSNIHFSDVDVETQSFSSVDETPLRHNYGQKIVDAALRVLLTIKSFGRRIIQRY